MATKTKLKIHVNRRLVEADRSPMTGLEILRLAGYDESHDLFRLDGERSSPAGEPVPHETSVELRNGAHFRAIPRDANFG